MPCADNFIYNISKILINIIMNDLPSLMQIEEVADEKQGIYFVWSNHNYGNKDSTLMYFQWMTDHCLNRVKS